MSIPFTHYHRPNGRTTLEKIDRDEDVEQQAQAFIDAGGVFEMELLTVGTISLTAEHPSVDGVVAIELCLNAPGVVGLAVDRLVGKAFARIPELTIERGLGIEDQLDALMDGPPFPVKRMNAEELEMQLKALRAQLDRERADATTLEREECARLVERFAKAYPQSRTVLTVVALNIRQRGK